VVWGVKDLRWRNPHAFAIQLQCWELEGALFARLNAKHAWRPKQVEFAREHLPAIESGARVRVATVIEGQVLVQTEYLQRPGMALT
jgi:hypothetical protein